MKPKILPWSMRGLNDSVKRWRVRNLLRDWKADIVCLQDTKSEFVSRAVVCSLWGCHHVDWCFLDSRGVPGEIFLIWEKRVAEKIECGGIFSCLLFKECI